ncbi:MAG: bifunctional glutamate N-acetyltransferase/amino-acid acetyltransferase ArgJ [Oscillospiraceae bacterium]|nr:bifunctional glutamate N-acetyltransferase/amino-acid acetyltransferase ArgJ [Oscillospiraceae bacterium]
MYNRNSKGQINMKIINGGVCAAKGFKANGIHCGIRKNHSKKDLALIVSDVPATAAAVYTQNLVKGAPLTVTKEHISDGIAQAVICNSGNANTCNANGIEIAEAMSALVERYTGVAAKNVVVASTGVIGQPLNLKPIENGMAELAAGLSADNGAAAAQAIMTTDTTAKEVAVEFTVSGKTCRMGGIAKGSGMIHPNMATMLVFITTDAAISREMLQKALSQDITNTFNMLSIDGDTSTNDMVTVLANGLAGNPEITAEGEDFNSFMQALNTITVQLCRMIAGDGEGATKLLECIATGADKEETAKIAAKSVICSSLLKAAMFGADANWGRVLCAIGYSGADVDVAKIGVSFRSAKGTVEVCRNGAGVPFSEEEAKEILLQNEIEILISLGDGPFGAHAWGCDLTYDYVKINGDYRT